MNLRYRERVGSSTLESTAKELTVTGLSAGRFLKATEAAV